MLKVIKIFRQVLDEKEIENDTFFKGESKQKRDPIHIIMSLRRFYIGFVPNVFYFLIVSSLVLSTTLEYSSHLIFLALLYYEKVKILI